MTKPGLNSSFGMWQQLKEKQLQSQAELEARTESLSELVDRLAKQTMPEAWVTSPTTTNRTLLEIFPSRQREVGSCSNGL